MGWYVFALVDRMPASRGRGLKGPLTARRVPGAVAIVERRADVPPPAFGTLRKHQAIVSRLAAAVPAILPVRFGTLLESEDLEEALEGREREIAEALSRVRHRVQFTWRAGAPKRGRRPAAATAPLSGREYLRRAARAAHPAPPPAFGAVRSQLRSLVVEERCVRGTATLPDSLYHLVDRESQERYRERANAIARAHPSLAVTGPWAPFAFAPETL